MVEWWVDESVNRKLIHDHFGSGLIVYLLINSEIRWFPLFVVQHWVSPYWTFRPVACFDTWKWCLPHCCFSVWHVSLKINGCRRWKHQICVEWRGDYSVHRFPHYMNIDVIFPSWFSVDWGLTGGLACTISLSPLLNGQRFHDNLHEPAPNICRTVTFVCSFADFLEV